VRNLKLSILALALGTLLGCAQSERQALQNKCDQGDQASCDKLAKLPPDTGPSGAPERPSITGGGGAGMTPR
jgi:hypothetical protein